MGPLTLATLLIAQVGVTDKGVAAFALGISLDAARSAGFWVFAAFVPVLTVGMVAAWRFTAEAEPSDYLPR